MTARPPSEGTISAPVSEEADPRFLPLEVRAPTADARCVEASLTSLDAEITPTNRFFIRSHFAVPKIDPTRWRLAIEGQVDRTATWSLDELRALPHRDLTATMECAGNGRITVRPKAEGVLWGHGAVSTARWRGVPLRTLLETVGVKPTSVEVLLRGADRGTEPGVEGELAYEMSISVAKALDADTLVVDEMNGAPLSASHGFPVRLIVPGWYGMASVKWLTHVVLTDETFQGHFRSRAYAYIFEGDRADAPRAPVTSMRVKSLISWPKESAVLAPGPHRIRGVAWSGDAPILRVDVSTEPSTGAGEVWRPARILGASTRHAWVHWELLCDFPNPGFYVVRARATDELGHTQPAQARWNFRGVGNNSIHSLPIEVRPGGPTDSV
ncbi:MAG: sulfite oxidase [Thermoplasmata archaeon]|nr:sulfite oxidase [Thermoplasmata archaeon]